MPSRGAAGGMRRHRLPERSHNAVKPLSTSSFGPLRATTSPEMNGNDQSECIVPTSVIEPVPANEKSSSWISVKVPVLLRRL